MHIVMGYGLLLRFVFCFVFLPVHKRDGFPAFRNLLILMCCSLQIGLMAAGKREAAGVAADLLRSVQCKFCPLL